MHGKAAKTCPTDQIFLSSGLGSLLTYNAVQTYQFHSQPIPPNRMIGTLEMRISLSVAFRKIYAQRSDQNTGTYRYLQRVPVVSQLLPTSSDV